MIKSWSIQWYLLYCYQILNSLLPINIYWGFWFVSVGSDTETGMINEMFAPEYADKYMTIGIIASVLLIIAMIAMFISSNQAKLEKNKSIAAGTSIFGGILALVAPIAFYYYLEENLPGFWIGFDQYWMVSSNRSRNYWNFR